MKKIYLLLVFCLLGKLTYGLSTIGNATGAVTAATFCAPATRIICQFSIAQTGASTTLNTVNFTTAAGYAATDVTAYQLWRNTTNTFATATAIGTTYVGPTLGPGAHAYTAGASALTSGPGAGVTYYYWITAAVPATAATGNSIRVSALTIVVGGGGTGGALTAQGAQTINKTPTAVTASVAPNPVCEGDNVTLTGAATNATSYAWAGPAYTSTLQNPPAFAVATTDAGVYTFSATNTCGTTTATTTSLVVNALPVAISGVTTVCVGTTSTLSDASGAGTWSSTAVGTATVDAAGVVTGVAPGSATIIFNLTSTGCQISTLVTVTATMPAITGALSFCQFTTTTLSDIVAGGTWTASNGTVATIGSTSGIASSLVAGMDTITYTLSGCSGTAVITVNPVPEPGAITGTTPVCVGSVTALVDTPDGGVWVSGDPTIATVDGVGNVTAIATGSVVLTYNLTNSCGTTGATFMLEIDRPVSPISAHSPVVCITNGDLMTDSVAGGRWSVSNGFATIDSITGLVVGVGVGIDTISYTLTNGCGTTVATYALSIGMPADWGVISGPSLICMGSSVTMSETATGGSWVTSGQHTTITSSGVVTGTSAGTDTIFYWVSAPCGQTFAYFIIQVDTNGTPLVSISANPGTTSCESIPVTYTANPTYGGSAPSYIWKVNGAFVGIDSTYTYVPVNGDVITCAMTSNYACANVPSASNFVIANVIPKVTPAVNVVAGTLGDTVCIGTLDTFFALPTNGGSLPGWQWSVNGTPMTTGATFIYTPNNGDVITVKMTSNATCAIPDTAVGGVTMTVNTTELPAVTVSINPNDTVCIGTLVTYTAHGIYGGRNPSYLWIKNGVNVATGLSYTYTPSNYDTIVCEFFSDASCAVPSTVRSSKTLMFTGPVVNPTVSVVSSGGSLVPFGHNDTLTATVSGGGPAPTYQWIVNGVIIAGATTSSYVLDYVSASNTVSCLVTGSGDCPAGETMVTLNVGFIPSGVGTLNETAGNWVLAPNPNSGAFSLLGYTAGNGRTDIIVTDIAGRIIYSNSVVPVGNVIHEKIDLGGDVADGIYLMKVVSGSETHIVKFTLNR